MRKTITKKILSSDISSFRITVKDGIPSFEELPLITVIGKVSEQKALKEIQNRYGKGNQYSIGKIEVKENLYSIKIDDFLAIAEKQSI